VTAITVNCDSNSRHFSAIAIASAGEIWVTSNEAISKAEDVDETGSQKSFVRGRSGDGVRFDLRIGFRPDKAGYSNNCEAGDG
jgi:hypothetical protein